MCSSDLERQFRHVFARAEKTRGNTGLALLSMLERRFDNVLYLSGLVASRPAARQMISHGHVYINGRRARTASQVLGVDDVATFSKGEDFQKLLAEHKELSKARTCPAWIEATEKPPEVRVLSVPTREDISVPTDEQLIVELLSK